MVVGGKVEQDDKLNTPLTLRYMAEGCVPEGWQVVTAAHWDANTHLDTTNAIIDVKVFDEVQYKLLQDPDAFASYLLQHGAAFVGFRGEHEPGDYCFDAVIARITAGLGAGHNGDDAVPYRFMWLPPLVAPVDGDDRDPEWVTHMLSQVAGVRETAARLRRLGHEPVYTGPLGHLWPVDDLPCKNAAELVAAYDFDEDDGTECVPSPRGEATKTAVKRKVGANAPCPCGSGRKYKKCCIDKGFEYLEDEEGGITKAIPLSPELRELFGMQLEKFREKFGRDPGPNVPLFFDAPPTEHAEFHMIQAMEAAGLPPELAYAFKKTGLLVTEMNQHLIPEKDLEEWDAAIEEYFDRLEAGELDDEIAPEEFEDEPS